MELEQTGESSGRKVSHAFASVSHVCVFSPFNPPKGAKHDGPELTAPTADIHLRTDGVEFAQSISTTQDDALMVSTPASSPGPSPCLILAAIVVQLPIIFSLPHQPRCYRGGLSFKGEFSSSCADHKPPVFCSQESCSFISNTRKNVQVYISQHILRKSLRSYRYAREWLIGPKSTSHQLHLYIFPGHAQESAPFLIQPPERHTNPLPQFPLSLNLVNPSPSLTTNSTFRSDEKPTITTSLLTLE